MSRQWLFAVFLLICGQLVYPIQPAYATSDALTNAALSTVVIYSSDDNDEPISYGSGVLISATGLVLTNYHVIADNQRQDKRILLFVPKTPKANRSADFVPYWGRILQEASDPDVDLALVQIDQTGDGEALPDTLVFPTLPLGDSDKLNIDEEIHVLGYPGIAGGSLITTRGQVIGLQEERSWVLTDAVIAGGNSGGAAINQAGELVAIPTRTITDDTRSGNTIGYMRPINLAWTLIEQAVNTERQPAKEEPAAEIFCEDDFTSNKQGWLLGHEDNDLLEREALIAQGELRRIVRFKQDAFTWLNVPDCTVKDFLFMVDVTIHHGEDEESGIALTFRDGKTANESSYYRVLYYLDNSYEVDRFTNGEWNILQERIPSRFIKLAEGSTNRIAVRMVGSQIVIYANGEELGTVMDSTLTKQGKIGLGLIGQAEEALEVAFDNLSVINPFTPGVIFYDEFVDNHHEWQLDRLHNTFVDCKSNIINGRLERTIRIKAGARSCYSTAPELYAEDFWLTVDATLLETSQQNQWVSIAFRYNAETAEQYVLRIDNNNQYTLEVYTNQEWRILQRWTPSSTIDLAPGVTNNIQIWVRGQYITLYINNNELTTIEDNILSNAGLIMLGGGGVTGVENLIAFDNLLVRQTPPQ